MISYSVKLRANTSRVQKDGTVSLYLQVIINRDIKFLPLDLKWPIDFVDNKEGKILPRAKKDVDYNDYLLIIGEKIHQVNEVFKIYRLQDQVLDMATFLYELKYYDRRKDFIVYMEVQLDLRLQYQQINILTHRACKGTVTKLKEFKGTLPFHMMTDKFLQQFASWLRKSPNNNSEGTIWTRIKDVINYLHRAEEDNLFVPRSYKKYRNSAPSSRIVYLDDEELNSLVKLYNANRIDPADQQVLAAFLFSCFTGLRISDVSRVEWGWLIGSVISFIPWKGRKAKRFIDVPLGKIAIGFVQKKTGLFFNLPTHQEMNRTLKTIALEAKIDKHLTFHISRHTFGTHYYRQTKDVLSLQRIMGHSKIETTMVYVHINDKDRQYGIDKMNKFFEDNVNYLRVVG
ncbi:Tyrosine recombinase XerD [compost metagenome]